MPRLFVALELPASIRESLTALKDDSLPARWTPVEQLHLTLRFIGEVDDSLAGILQQVLGSVHDGGFEMHLYGTGTFPSVRRARVLFAGMDARPELLALQAAIEEVVRSTGVHPDEQRFTPHVTIARLKTSDPEGVQSFLERTRDWTLPPFRISAFTLFESRLGPSGAVHLPRQRYPLT